MLGQFHGDANHAEECSGKGLGRNEGASPDKAAMDSTVFTATHMCMHASGTQLEITPVRPLCFWFSNCQFWEDAAVSALPLGGWRAALTLITIETKRDTASPNSQHTDLDIIPYMTLSQDRSKEPQDDQVEQSKGRGIQVQALDQSLTDCPVHIPREA
jgi:hypothetical protein